MTKKAVAKKAPASAKATAGKPAKKVAKKAVAKKAPASAKATAGKPAKKVAAKKVAKKAAKKTVTKEKFYSMVTEASYFAAQNDGNKKGATDYWMEAESAISKKFKIK